MTTTFSGMRIDLRPDWDIKARQNLPFSFFHSLRAVNIAIIICEVLVMLISF